MGKRSFRRKVSVQQHQPDYPNAEDFERSRREFCRQLGVTLLGAGALTACGDRPLLDQKQPPKVDNAPEYHAGGKPAQPQPPEGHLDAGPALIPDAEVEPPEIEQPEYSAGGKTAQPQPSDGHLEAGLTVTPDAAKLDAGPEHPPESLEGDVAELPARADAGAASCPIPPPKER